MAVTECIRQFLALDVIDSDPALVSSRNSNRWATSGDVPEYAYKSLGTLWVGPGTSSNTLLRTYKLAIW